MQHGINLIPQLKCEDQQMIMQQPLQSTAIDEINQQQQSPRNNTQGTLHRMANTDNQNDEISGLNGKENLSTDSYSYLEDIAGTMTAVSNTNNTGNKGIINMPQDAQLSSETVKNSDPIVESYMCAPTNIMSHHVNDMYSIQNQQQHQNQPQQQQQLHTTNIELPQSMDYNLKMTPTSGNGLSDAEQLEHTVIHQNLHQQQLQLPQQSLTPNQFIFTENNVVLRPPQKKRGRKKKIQSNADNTLSLSLQLLTGSNECGVTPANGELPSK